MKALVGIVLMVLMLGSITFLCVTVANHKEAEATPKMEKSCMVCHTTTETALVAVKK